MYSYNMYMKKKKKQIHMRTYMRVQNRVPKGIMESKEKNI